MSDIVIEVVTKTITQPQGKKYKQMELIYKNKSFQDKVETKKIIDFYAKDIWPHLEDSNAGDVFTIKREKEGEYWTWKGITAGAAGKPSASSSGTTTGTAGRGTYVADADKQVMIIRQSSISSAVNLLKDTNPNPKAVLDVAEMFESFVLNGPGEKTSSVVPKANALPEDLDDDLPY